MNSKEMTVLELLNKDSLVSQRKLAQEAGVSVGNVNTILKYLQKQALIEVVVKGGKNEYRLTTNGLSELESHIEEIKLKRILASPDMHKQVKQAVILSAGKREDFNIPVGFLEVQGQRLIDRQIAILRKYGIEKIVIVAGYKPHLYQTMSEEVCIVYNNNYQYTGTMASLAMAQEEITDDFLLIESDLYFDEKAILELLQFENRNCMLITNLSQSGDEAFVEIRNDFIYKMGKDIAQFNQVHGEMIGMSKLSLDIYQKMLEEFAENQNPYVNYEYIIMDVAGRYSIGYLKINDLYWSEVDNLRQYEDAKRVANILSLEKEDKWEEVRVGAKGSLGIKQAVILAAGENDEFEQPIGLVEFGNQKLIERNIELLHKNGVQDIVVVTGYKSNYYKWLEHNENIRVVENAKYKWTGTMYSLALASDFITQDFILLESDLVFENRALSNLLKSKHENCILIANESGSGDEAFVEIRNSSLYKMSKDIHQLKRIDGEMIGISKISFEIYRKMLSEFEDNKNPYLNYEYILLEVARGNTIGYTKVDGLAWTDIDNKHDYEKAKKSIFPKIKQREAEDQIQEIRKYLTDIFKVEDEDIGEVVTLGGMTNTNFQVAVKGKDYVFRYPGMQPKNMINRVDEKINSQIAYELGIDTSIAYFDAETGIKVAEFIADAETLNGKTARKEENMLLTSRVLKKLHSSQEKFNNIFNVFSQIEIYETILDEVQGSNFPDYYSVKKSVMPLESSLKELGAKLVPCHNDTVAENFVKSGTDKIYLIDWEYGGMNDPMWDLAAHFLECNFSPKDEELFLSLYFDGEIDEKSTKRIFIYKICQDFLWSIWTKIKEAKGADFGTYGIDRFNRAKLNLRKINLL